MPFSCIASIWSARAVAACAAVAALCAVSWGPIVPPVAPGAAPGDGAAVVTGRAGSLAPAPLLHATRAPALTAVSEAVRRKARREVIVSASARSASLWVVSFDIDLSGRR